MKIAELSARAGEVIGTSDWMDITQERIALFADATDDHQFIHVDPDKAKLTPFGQTIAHGFLSLSLLVPLLESCAPKLDMRMMVNYGLNKLRFLAPVKSGKRIRAQFKLVELVEKRPGQWQQTLEATVEIEGEDKPALIAEWVLLLFE